MYVRSSQQSSYYSRSMLRLVTARSCFQVVSIADGLTKADLKALSKRHKLAGTEMPKNPAHISPFIRPTPVKYFHGKLASMRMCPSAPRRM
jgi:hypothetical protein